MPRIARRQDLPAIEDLRVKYLAEIARGDPRCALLPDVRDRTRHALPVWIEQEDRVLLVAEEASGGLAGYATGLVSVWPPIWRLQHVGEVAEVYVVPERRGAGIGKALLAELALVLTRRGAQVLRAPLPVRVPGLLERFTALGFAPLQIVMERNLEEP